MKKKKTKKSTTKKITTKKVTKKKSNNEQNKKDIMRTIVAIFLVLLLIMGISYPIFWLLALMLYLFLRKKLMKTESEKSETPEVSDEERKKTKKSAFGCLIFVLIMIICSIGILQLGFEVVNTITDGACVENKKN